jgi:cytochrome c peroxidase
MPIENHENLAKNDRSIARMMTATSGVSAGLLLLLLSIGSSMAQDTPALQELGKRIFFDNISNPPRQSCSTCHEAENGWTGGVAGINKKGVAIPGANPHTVGGRKPPSNAYASFSPAFGTRPATNPNISDPVDSCRQGLGFACFGGIFWDGRAEGNATALIAPPNVTGTGATPHVGVEIFDTEPQKLAYVGFIGPVADQALGPFPNDVEQNVPDGSDGGLPGAGAVCRHVNSAKYAELFTKAWHEPIDCGAANVAISFKRIALAIAAWQHSDEVNSFSSKRDQGIRNGGVFPLPNLTSRENLGRDLFYGKNDSGLNRLIDNGSGALIPKNAGCAGCHNSHGAGSVGNELTQIYSDFAYHHIGLPANFEIDNFDPNNLDAGMLRHTDPSAVFNSANPNATPFAGHVKTPTLRNVDKRRGNGFPKAYMHNGYFKSLEQVVHFYNTATLLRDPVACPAGTTAEQAIARNCWPVPEFDTPNQAGNFGLLGNLGLTADEEAALVAYLTTLTDTVTPKQPEPYKGG